VKAFGKGGRFLAASVGAGIAIAVVILLMQEADGPDLELQPAVVPSTSVLPRTEGPVSYADAVDKASPAVVNVFTTKVLTERVNPLLDDPFFRRFFGEALRDRAGQTKTRRENSLGSGVIVDPRGYVVTNNHVISGADEIRVVLGNGSVLSAEVVGTDPDTDLAVLRVEDNPHLSAISLASSAELRVGDVVFAIGNPFGVGQTVTMGIVSATGRHQLGITNFENFIQTDAAINPGNSGGALIDAQGNLVGINTAIFSQSGGYQGIGFAIPVNMVRGVMAQLVKYGKVRRGWLGVAGQDVTPELAESFGLKENTGVLISSVVDGGPADQAGVRPGDVISSIDDDTIDSAFDVVNAVAGKPPGTLVRVRGWRGSKPLDLQIRLDRRPPDS